MTAHAKHHWHNRRIGKRCRLVLVHKNTTRERGLATCCYLVGEQVIVHIVEQLGL